MSPHGSGSSVILADNDAMLRNVIRYMLQDGQRQVFLARDGNEAVALAQRFTADLAVLDIAMPNLNGIDACRMIRALPGYAEVPIIMLTGYGDQRTRAAAVRAGATGFMTKPFQPDLLLELVNTSIAHAVKPHPPKPPPAKPQPGTPDMHDPGVAAAANEHRHPATGLDTIRIYRAVDRIKEADPKRPRF